MKAIILPLCVVLISASVFSQEKETAVQPPRTISVSGTASGYAIPDTIIWDVQMSVNANDALEAKDASDEQVKTLLKVLKEKGIKAGRVETGLIKVSREAPETSYSVSKSGPGNTYVTRTITIRQDGITDFPLMLKTLVENSRAKVTYKFICSKHEEITRATIAEATAAAKLKAEAMAEAAGDKVKRMLSVNEYVPADWNINEKDRIPRDVITDVYSPDATIVTHSVFAVFEIE